MSAKYSLDNALMEVKRCSKAVLAAYPGNGKSPCFLGARSLWVFGPDWLVYNLMFDNGVKYLD